MTQPDSNSRFFPGVYFKLVYTEKTFYQDIYSDYSCKELYDKILENVNNNLLDEDNTINNIEKFEIIPARNTEGGLPLRKIDDKLYDILGNDDMVSFYIRLC